MDNPWMRGVVMSDATCAVDGCERTATARGLCGLHYQRLRRLGSVGEAGPRRRTPPKGLTASERFWSRVLRSEHCWEWVGNFTGNGYGRFRLPSGQKVLAHRYAYEEANGPIPDGLHLDHLCRNRACVNPTHLEPVTPTENTLRGIGPTAVNARKTHCIRGHEFTPENTYLMKRGGRNCRACWTIDKGDPT